MIDIPGVDWALVAILGVLAGIGDIIARYRDSPGAALKNIPAFFYLVINALAAVVALALIRIFGWATDIAGATPANNNYWRQVIPQILVAGLGAIVILRSSITVNVAGQPATIGLARFLDNLLVAVDNAVDRKRAQARDKAIQIMDSVSFTKAYAALPTYILALMLNLPEIDQKAFADEILKIPDAKMDETVKSRLLGLAILKIVGPDVLTATVKSLGTHIYIDLAGPAPTPAPGGSGAPTGSPDTAGTPFLPTAGNTAPVAPQSGPHTR